MATYLLDTSVIIDVLNRKRGRRALLQDLLQQGHSLACCPINVTEVYSGVRSEDEASAEKFLRSLDYYEITWEIARDAGLLRRDWARKGISLALPDVTLAAVALAHGLTLITDNLKDYPMAELRLYPLPRVN